MISVIVPTRNRAVFLADAVRSVIKQNISADDFEVLVVDNGSTDQTCEVVRKLGEESGQIRYFYEKKPGLHIVRHLGAQKARGEILAFVDDDVLAPAGWLSAILKSFSNERIACVGGKIVPKWEAEMPSWLGLFNNNGGGYLSLLDLGDESLELHWPRTLFGCNFSVRKSVLYEVGGFHPDAMGEPRRIWFRGDGETGFQKKVYDAGYKVFYEPKAWLYHRIPGKRLRPEYFFRRAFSQGISDSYTYVRSKRRGAFYLSLNAGRYALLAAGAYIKSLRYAKQSIRFKTTAWYFCGWWQHQVRLAFSKTLRSHVLQDDYL